MTPPSDIDEQVDYWLKQFARFDRINDEVKRLGYPSRSPCFIGGGETARFDDWASTEEESIWKTNCRAMEAIVLGLPEVDRMVIEIIYLGRRNIWDYDQDMLISTLKSAEPEILVAMRKRNIPIYR